MHMKQIVAALIFIACAASATSSLRAQAVPSATTREFSLTAGVTASIFQPDYLGGNSAQSNNQSLQYGIGGPGGYVDLRFRRWIQFEAEGRWMRMNVRSTTATSTGNVNIVPEDNYLIGPRVPFRMKRFTPYVKVLGGFGVSNVANANQVAGNSISGLALAYGGGTDFRLSKHLSVRLVDFELQQWFLNVPATSTAAAKSITIQPYGASAGISYKIF